VIDVTELAKVLPPWMMQHLNEEAVATVLGNIADGARAEWFKQAGATLFRTRRDYMHGIQPVSWVDKLTTVISLVGMLPRIVEHGMPRTDLHDTLLGPDVPTVPMGERGKHERVDGGFYRAIPFRHAGPNAGGAVGMPMGRPYGGHTMVDDAKRLGRSVYKLAKKLAPTTGMPGGPTKWGGRLKNLEIPKLKRHHAVNIYEGMVRQEKTYKKATQSSYMTFRTISTGSRGWVRPDTTPGVQLSKKVVEYVHGIAAKAFAAYFEGWGSGK